MDSSDLVFSWLLSGVFLLGLVSIVGGLLHARRTRLLTHQERMKALEVGREMPDDALPASGGEKESKNESLAPRCFTTALWVGFWGFLFAANAGGAANQGIAIAIAASAGSIGVTAMICGTVLATRTPAERTRRVASTNKPIIESDAFDVVSSRG